MDGLLDFYSLSDVFSLFAKQAGSLLLILTPLAILISLIEGWYLSMYKKQSYDWKATATSLACKAGQSAVQVLPYAIHIPVFNFVWKYRLLSLSVPSDTLIKSTGLILILFISHEFYYYWLHRASHRVRVFWAHHIVHHSPTQLNMSAAYRTGWLGKHLGLYLFYVPLVYVGFSPLAVFTMTSLNFFYQLWIHNTWMPRLGWLEYMINTPSSHRVHHSRNQEYINANYGGVLIIFDILFGTYIPEKREITCDYGLRDQIESYNPFIVQFREWKLLMYDIFSSKSFPAAVRTLLGPPKN